MGGGGIGSRFRVSRRRELDVGEPQFALEIDNLTGISAFEEVTGELEDVAADEESQGQEEYRHGEEAKIDGDEEEAEDRGRDSDHVQDEARGTLMSLEPVLYQSMGRQRRVDHGRRGPFF
jgi:hypothetical protein